MTYTEHTNTLLFQCAETGWFLWNIYSAAMKKNYHILGLKLSKPWNPLVLVPLVFLSNSTVWFVVVELYV